MKQCTKCKEWKAFSEFTKHNQRPNGVGAWCLSCARAHDKERYAANPEKKLVMNRRWLAANLENRRKSRRAWQVSHPEKVLEYNHAYVARQTGMPGRITGKEWKDLCEKYGNKCLRCGRNDVKLTLDHVIPSSLGGLNVIENAQPLCKSCNSIKHKDIVDYRKQVAK